MFCEKAKRWWAAVTDMSEVTWSGSVFASLVQRLLALPNAALAGLDRDEEAGVDALHGEAC
jgi:hypothetical protein